MHALKLSLIAQTGSAPERWAQGLSVMLRKIARVAIVTKLRAILLRKLISTITTSLSLARMMDLTKRHGIVPEEIFSEKERTAEDAVLVQVLAYNITRQKRAPFIVASANAAQCHDRIAHSIAALSLKASKVPDSSIRCMLKPIREMEFFINTAFGESKTSVSGKNKPKQGAC